MIDLIGTLRDYTQAGIDGVYVDSLNGVAGTDWPIGTPTHPSNNLTDALAIAAANNLRRLYLVQPQYGLTTTFTLPSDLSLMNLVGAGPGTAPAIIDGNNKDVTGTIFTRLTLTGYLTATNTFRLDDCAMLRLLLTGTNCRMDVYRCLIDMLDLGNTHDIWMYHCYGETTILTLSGFTQHVYMVDQSGHMYIIGLNSGGRLYIWGNGLQVDISNTCNNGRIYLYGDTKFTNLSGAGVLVYDFTNRPNIEVPVNINAISASETNFLSLAADETHYTIDDLVLKCANPGANTVNVRLYKLVNGVLTNTQTFAITNANFATYFDINSMFGLKSLAGDNIKITVQATAGGPYAVIGSYCYRSA